MPKSIKKYGGKPFDEAIAYFRNKLNVPTKHWDDLMGGMHAKGFMVAGAMKAELLTDLRGSVDRAISEGVTLAGFRKDFDSIVEKHGWIYKGGRNWRTKVIYDTNLRSAYQAGRYQQMKDPDVVALRPFWRYLHSGSVNPREEHLGWDGMILAHDDPFWDTHFPPNGWGCKCRVLTLSQRDMKRMGKKGPDKAPAIKYREYKDRKGNTLKVPHGIDPGFDYNVGKSADMSYKALAESFESLDYDVARPFMNEFLAGPVFERFYAGKIQGEFPVAVLSEIDQVALGSKAQTVWLHADDLKIHKNSHPDIQLGDYQKIQKIIQTGEAYKQGTTRLVYLKQGDIFYRAALKRTQNRRENYYLSLFKTDPGRADRQIRKKLERIR